jgi:hypothetical protein
MSIGLRAAILALAAGLLALQPATQAAQPAHPYPDNVDLALILAVDVSRSMDYEEQRVQREGYVGAFRSAELQQAIRSGAYGRIAVAYMEWSSAYYQRVLVPWTVIGTPTEINAFADKLERVPITTDSRTSIANALRYAYEYFRPLPVKPDRRTIDVSGDGANNDGGALVPVRDQIVADGITINGLPIIIRPSNLFGPYGSVRLDDYYKDCVTGGPTSFVVPVTAVTEFAAAIRRKLILEIVSNPPSADIVPVSSLGGSHPKVDCVAAEAQRNFNDPFANP